jgi:hypothetical protein
LLQNWKENSLIIILTPNPIILVSNNYLEIKMNGCWSFKDPDPGSGMSKKSRSGSGMNIPDHISERLETIFWGLKIL